MSDTKLIPADHPLVRYTGRVDDRDPKAPVMAWQGCQAEFRIRTGKLALHTRGHWRNWLEVVVDGLHVKREVPSGDGVLEIPLHSRKGSDGAHRVTVFKRTEAYSGEYTLLGMEADRDAALFPLEPPPALGIEFYGDSITAGACNEDVRDDQYDDLATHNNYLSYGAETCRILGARYGNCAISGMGICETWNEYRARDVWDKVRLTDKSLLWDFTRWQPDVVVVNLGQNDEGFPASQGRPFPAEFRERYVDYIMKLSSVYPRATIVHASGGMGASFDSTGLREAMQGALSDLRAHGLPAHYFIFDAFNHAHPRVAVHLRMARQLADFLRPLLPRS